MDCKFLTVDIDDTLLTGKVTRCDCCGGVKYSDPQPIQGEINKVNAAYDSGVIIILHTGRGWNQYEITVTQLSDLGIKYNQLVMGKPPGPYIDATLNFNSIGDINA